MISRGNFNSRRVAICGINGYIVSFQANFTHRIANIEDNEIL